MTAPVQPPPVFADPVEASNYAAYVQAQRDEYGAYVADHVIYHNQVPIFNEGQAVPKSTVQANPWLLEHVRAIAPATPIGEDRTEALRVRAARLAEEQAAIEAELAEAEAEAAKEPAAYRDKNVNELREILRGAGLKVSGNRPELIARLAEMEAAEAAEVGGVSADDNGDDRADDDEDADTAAPEGR